MMYPEWVPDWFINGPSESAYWVAFLLAFLFLHIMIHLRFGLLGRHREDPKHGRRHRYVRMEFRLPTSPLRGSQRHGRRHGGQRSGRPVSGT